MVSDEPKQPEWPMNVKVFHPPEDGLDADGIKKHIDQIKADIAHTQDPQEEYVFMPWNDGVAAKDAEEAAKMKADYKAQPDHKTDKTYTSGNHFSTKHYALLFAPGEYKDCDFEVGYYVGMAGLGNTATGEGAVRFTGEKSGPFVDALNKQLAFVDGGTIAYWNSGLCLDTFWRSAENFSAENVRWAVSQAAPIRRIDVKKDLTFGEGGAYSSGGFVANAKVGGTCDYIANQQWFSRGVQFDGKAQGGSWNTVFSGCSGNVPPHGKSEGGNDLVNSVEETPKVRLEKPYIVINGKDYELHVPKVTTTETTGAHLDGSDTEVRCFSKVKVGKAILPTDEFGNYAEYDDATFNKLTDEDAKLTLELQKALDEGKDLVLSPGIYFLTQPLIVKKPNQVILGLGLATLIAPQNGAPCIRVEAGTPGVRIASLVLEASVQDGTFSEYANSDKVRSLIDFGEPDKTGTEDPGDPSNPGLIADLFTRVGGSNLDRTVSTDAMVRIFAGHVIGDNLWLWRADHVKLDKENGEKANDPRFELYHQVRIWDMDENLEPVLVDGKRVRVDECICKNAIVVEGNDVKMYGLFAEHTTEDQMIWKGERGSVSFFQCELPYDVDESYAHTGYHVHEDVKEHTGAGIGVYSNFTCFDVNAHTGLKFPSSEKVNIINPFTRWLNGKDNSTIERVLYKGEEKIGDAVSMPKDKQLSRAWIN